MKLHASVNPMHGIAFRLSYDCTVEIELQCELACLGGPLIEVP